MITALLPEQIARYWDIIKYAVERSVPPIPGEHPDKLNRILSSALSGKIKVWVVRSHDKSKLESIILTEVLYDYVTDITSLLIYSVCSFETINRTTWPKTLSYIARYAKAKKIDRIVAYSSLKGIVDISKKLGADTSYTFISFDVSKLNDIRSELDESNN